MSPLSRGFRRRHTLDPETAARVPPGQHVVADFPVLSIGPTPHTPMREWSFEVVSDVDESRRWAWEAFRSLPTESITTDIHCVTSWSKLGTVWEGVSLDTLLDGVNIRGEYVVASSDGGYQTNLPIEDVTGGNAWIAFDYDGAPLAAEHGGPARLLVPHLYLWKSANWVRSLRVTAHDEPGFWETHGYHDRGDPWFEQRYWGD